MNQTLAKIIMITIIMIVIIVVGLIISSALTDWVMEPVTDPNWTPDIIVGALAN